MRKGIITEIDWKYIGAELANCSDSEQADFFNSFANEVRSFGSHYQSETQMLAISVKLKPETKEILKSVCWDGEK